jgi:hypothetical protein
VPNRHFLSFDDEIKFSRAVNYNLHPVPLPRVFKDATGGFGTNAPMQGWIQVYDSEGYCGEASSSAGMTSNILRPILAGEPGSHRDWYDYLCWQLRNFGFQSGQIVDLGQLDMIMPELLARRAERPATAELDERERVWVVLPQASTFVSSCWRVGPVSIRSWRP